MMMAMMMATIMMMMMIAADETQRQQYTDTQLLYRKQQSSTPCETGKPFLVSVWVAAQCKCVVWILGTSICFNGYRDGPPQSAARTSLG